MFGISFVLVDILDLLCSSGLILGECFSVSFLGCWVSAQYHVQERELRIQRFMKLIRWLEVFPSIRIASGMSHWLGCTPLHFSMVL